MKLIKENYLEYVYSCLAQKSLPDNRILPPSFIFYCRAALEHKFPGKKFTIEEVKSLIKEVYFENKG